MFRRCWRLLNASPTTEDLVAAFKVLGLRYHPHHSPIPTLEEVRRRYKEMARLHHPDLSSGDDNSMKVVNTAYDLIHASGVLRPGSTTSATRESTSSDEPNSSSQNRFVRKAGTRRRRFSDNFASGDTTTWAMRSALEWQTMMNSTDTLSEEEMRNPANHPFSHSRFFTFEEDASIYRMIRGGATVSQVARTLGKPSTFIEKRLHNAQFKQRIQYVLRHEKRQETAEHKKGSGAGGPVASSSSEVAPRRVVGTAKEGGVAWQTPFSSSSLGRKLNAAGASSRKKAWDVTYPEWRAPEYLATMTMEEQGKYSNLIAREKRVPDAAHQSSRRPAASKIGRSYINYARFNAHK